MSSPLCVVIAGPNGAGKSTAALRDDALNRALRRSANRMRRIHAALGLPIVTGREDRVVDLDPLTLEEIPPDEVDAFIERAKRMLDE